MSVDIAFPDFSANRDSGMTPAFVLAMHAIDGDPTWVSVTGDLDVGAAPRLEFVLGLIDSPLVILDLRGLSSVDSSGVEVIRDASTQARRQNRGLVLVRGPVHAVPVLELSDVADVSNIVEIDRPEAWERPVEPYARRREAA